MKKTQRKDALRNIRKQAVSFLSIVVIAMMGVTAFLGISYTAEAMRVNGSAAYGAMSFRDMEVISTRLLTAEDLSALKATEGVLDVEPLWQTGADAYRGNERQSVTLITVTSRLNLPVLKEGRLPETAFECAVEQRLADRMGWQVGDSIERLEVTDAAGQYLLGGAPLTVTAIVEHPDHIQIYVPDTLYILVSPDAFDQEALDGCCMKALIAVERPEDMNRFSAAYDDAVAPVMARIEAMAPERAALRDEGIRTEAQEKIDSADDALKTAEGKLKDGRFELDEGWKQLAEGKEKLLDGEKELKEAAAQLQDAWQELASGEQELKEARQQLDDARAQLEQGGDALDTGAYELYAAKMQLENGWDQLEDAKGTIRDALRDAVDTVSHQDSSEWIDWAEKQPADVGDSRVTAKELWITDGVKADLNRSLGQIAEDTLNGADIPEGVLRAAYDTLYENEPDPPAYDPEAMRAYLAEQVSEGVDRAAAGYRQLVDGCAQWDDGHAQYLRGADTYTQGRQQYAEALAAYEAGERAYLEGLAAYEAGLREYTEGKAAYEQGVLDLEAGRRQIDESQRELEEGEARYAEGLAAYEAGVRQRDDAVSELAALEPGRWIVLDCRGNASFVQLDSTSANFSSLQMTFSMLFVVIGALVIYATVSKMVDEQRTLVGATKALGFSNWEIFAKYLVFGLFATALGAGIGILLARFLLEGFILDSCTIFYSIALDRPLLIVGPTLAVALGGVVLSVAAVTFACLRLVRTPAIRLMQAPVPKARNKAKGSGKQVLSLYSRLVLLNIRTDIKRVLVTVVSVAGCCALVVIGFTLRNAMDKTLWHQYGEVVAYDGCVRYDHGDEIEEKLQAAGAEYVPLYDGNVTFQIRGMGMLELYCGDIGAIEGMFHLADWKTGAPLPPTDDGVLIQRRTAEVYGLDAGSEFELTMGDGRSAVVRVAGVFENYIGRAIVMSPACYAARFGREMEPNAFFVRFRDGDWEALLGQLKETGGYVDYTPADQGRDMFLSATSVIDIVVALFILMAAIMAGMVLMNLTNIYILQKKRELTVMRINGFTTREVIAYVTRETIFTTVVGILLGFGEGSLIGYAIVRALEQSFVQLERGVCFSAWAYAAAMTILFTVIVNGIALRKVKHLKLTDAT